MTAEESLRKLQEGNKKCGCFCHGRAWRQPVHPLESGTCRYHLTEDEQKKLTLYERMHMDDSTQHTLVPTADSDAIVQIYREEKGAAISSDMEIAGVQQRDIVLTQDDFAKLSEQLGADYIIYFRVTSSMPTISVGFFSSGQKTNVTTDFRIWDKTTGKYVFAKRYQTTGSSSSVLSYGFGSSANAVKDGLNKALEQIDKDKATIVSCVK